MLAIEETFCDLAEIPTLFKNQVLLMQRICRYNGVLRSVCGGGGY